ncbi:MAG: SDR family NAD(P)-dependent oxidoreductase [Acetobacteraceae bacterium]
MPSTYLVSGASAGFGAAIARRAIADGHRVIAAARRRERLEELHKELGERLLPLVLDVTDRVAVARLPGSLPAGWQEPDVLVNNAGLAKGMAPAPQAVLDNWDTMVATNITGLMHLTRAILPGMVARDRGHVINIGSVAGHNAYPGGNVYGASKAFVAQFTLGLRADLNGTNVHVTDVQPGLVGETEFSMVRLGDAARAAAIYQGTTPLTPEDIAEAVAWIVGLPDHVNINRLEMMPTCQAPGGTVIKRR